MFHVERLSPPVENRFVMELLTLLRKDRFSAMAWWEFLKRSWQMSSQTAGENPSLLRSWRRMTSVISLLSLAILLLTLTLEGSTAALRLFSGLVFFVVWQQSDLFWHLGLNRRELESPLYPRLGSAIYLTWLRALAASFLLARLIGGLPTSSTLALLVFLIGVATDILDGQFARRTHTTSRLGQIGDGETDFSLYLALTLILIQNGVLPIWLGLLMLARFILPLIAALASYFLLTRAIRFGSTIPGKLAGLFQTLYFLLILAPMQFAPLLRPLQLPLLILTVLCLLLAPLAQLIANLRPTRA